MNIFNHIHEPERQQDRTVASSELMITNPGAFGQGTGKKFTSHQVATILVLQENMRRQYDYDIGMVTGLYGSSVQLPSGVGELIDHTFPEVWSKLQILDLGGVWPASGPTGLVLIENGDLPENHQSYVLGENGIINWGEQQELMNAQEIQYSRRMYQRILEPHGVNFHVPNLKNPNLMQCVYECRSLRMDSLETFAHDLDKYVIALNYHQAQIGSWDEYGRKPGSWVICAPEDAYTVQKRTGKAPVTMDWMPAGTALVGFKASESHASMYFMPYVPMQYIRAIDVETNKPKLWIKTRFGMVSSDPRAYYSSDRGPIPELWKVKV